MTLFAIAFNKLRKDLGYGLPLPSIVSSVSFAVSLFFYLYVFGSFFRIAIYPLIDRVTFYLFFQEHVINEYFDNIIAIVATTLWFFFSLKNQPIRYYFSIVYGGTGTILAIISPDNIVFDVFTLLSLPLIIGVALYHYYYYYHKQQKNILNFNSKLTLRYISLAVIAINTIGIVVSILAFFIAP